VTNVVAVFVVAVTFLPILWANWLTRERTATDGGGR
jgi:putative spermidine/putrescine transport system permease protein